MLFQGIVVAMLPFTPIGAVAHITHSQLDGEDLRMCSVGFLYLLTLFSLRNIIKKTLGQMRPRTREPFSLAFPSRFLSPKDGEEWWLSPKLVYFSMVGFYGYSLYKLMRKH